jgi:hypothetical protein
MRLALAEGVQPRRFALGAAAALAVLHPSLLDADGTVDRILGSIWEVPVGNQSAIAKDIEAGLRALRAWRDTNFRDPQRLEYR